MDIVDAGVGFDRNQRSHGLGLSSIEERVTLLKGHLSIDTAPGQGTTIRLRVPLSVGADALSIAGTG
jgi:signal transduction histidine kinase